MQVTTHLTEVHQAVLDYAKGWHLGEVDRMARSLHPAFMRRRAASDEVDFETRSRDSLLDLVARGPRAEQDCAITVVLDDVYDTIATARCYSCRYVDLVHLGRFEQGWRVVHALHRNR